MSEPVHVHEHHHPGPKTYAAVLGALLVLTVITVGAAYLDFGSMNTVIALLIASLKGSLVALFFMHLKNDKFNALIFTSGLFFLAVFLIFTLFDVSHRTPLYPGNLKAPVLDFPGAQVGKPFQPSDGRQYPFNEPPAAKAAAAPAAAPAPAKAAH
jgi:cytochrome c oxidase subunit 4